ncbi:MAG: glycosyltransferase, partial [Candidatus Nanopelagicales bacterium]
GAVVGPAVDSPEVVFLVAGDGAEADYVRRRAYDEGLPIRMLGWRDDVGPVFSASDLTVLTSDNEGTPISLVQAGMAGVAAVASDVGSVREIVEDGVTGVLRPPAADALAEAVAELLADPRARASMGSAAVERTRRFTTEALATAHLALYRDLLTGR